MNATIPLARLSNPNDLLLDLLNKSGRAYMVSIHESRTHRKRHYRIFVADTNGKITDITPLICRILGKGWDEIRGTYNVSGTYKKEDAVDLSDALATELLISYRPIIFML